MGVAFVFVVLEYTTQSHLSTEDYEDAMRGLRRTRKFKKHTAWLRDVPDYIIDIFMRIWSKASGSKAKYTRDHQAGRYSQGGRRSLLWTWSTKRQRGRRTDDGILEGIPLHRQDSPQASRHTSARSPSTSKDTEMEPYSSPISHEGEYPPELPTQPVEALEEGRYRGSYRHL